MADVVLIDDDDDIRELGTLWLGMESHSVVSAADGTEGIEVLRRSVAQGRHPVVVLDVQMPDIDGWDVLDTIRDDPTLVGVPVILCTVQADEVSHARGYRLGADGYITKPYDLDSLQAAVAGLAELDRSTLLARRAEQRTRG